MSLVFTCRQVAAEMRGLALGANTITFTTFFSEVSRAHAGRYHTAYLKTLGAQAMLVGYLASQLLTSELASIISTRYPAFTPILEI